MLVDVGKYCLVRPQSIANDSILWPGDVKASNNETTESSQK
jgi:hypothetical protein